MAYHIMSHHSMAKYKVCAPVPVAVLLYVPEGPDTGVGGTAPNRPDCRPTLSSRSVRPLLTDLPALQYSVPSMYRAEGK